MSSSISVGQAARDAITQRNGLASPLLRLPAELRNQIFAHAFGPHDIWVDKFESNDQWSVIFFRNPQSFTVRQSLDLTQVCRQVYAETKLLYWESRIFRFGPPSEDDSSIRNVLELLSAEKRGAIQRIAVHKEEVKLEALWEQLPRLRGLKMLLLWGSYFTWGTNRVLAGQLPRIDSYVRAYVGHAVDVSLDVEPMTESKWPEEH